SLEDWLDTHDGLDELTFTAQRLYFKRQYAETRDLCVKLTSLYLEKRGKGVRIASIREILEIGAKAAMHVDDLESLEYFYDLYQDCGGAFPGYNQFLAAVLRKLGRPVDALTQYITYLEMRKQDALVWQCIGQILRELGAVSPSIMQDLARLSLAAFMRSYRIVVECKNWKSMAFAVERRQKQLDELSQDVVKSLDLLGFASPSDVWSRCEGEMFTDSALSPLDACSGALEIPVRWIATQLSTTAESAEQQGDDDEEEEKNVADL
ncbi:hypothetical protein FBU59_006422, partial [Linderina macrospora]